MFTALVVLWLGAPAELAAHRSEITAWASAQGARVVAPAAAAGPRYDARLADEVEALLEQARTEAPASSGLERAEAILLAHPELPQAAWLLSERYTLGAQAAAARGESANELAGRAVALEGERAATAGTKPLAARLLVAGAPATPLTLSPSRRDDQLYIDGVLVGPGSLVPGGRHHLRLVRGGATVSAAWFEHGAGLQPLLVDPTLACDAFDLAGVSASPADAPEAAPGILCKIWVAARRGPLGGTEVSRCQASRCGAWEPARRPLAAATTGAGVAEVEPGDPWPTWLTWSLLGAGAVAATGIVLWQTGAFEQPAPSTEFVFSGPDAAAYRF